MSCHVISYRAVFFRIYLRQMLFYLINYVSQLIVFLINRTVFNYCFLSFILFLNIMYLIVFRIFHFRFILNHSFILFSYVAFALFCTYVCLCIKGRFIRSC